MEQENRKFAANQNGETAQKISGDSIQAGYNNEVNTTEYQTGSALQTMLHRAEEFKASQAQNDNTSNGDNGGDNTPPPSSAAPFEASVEDDDGNSYQVYIDIDEVSNRTHIEKTELVALCEGTAKNVAIPTDLTELTSFITVNQGAASTAGTLAKKRILPAQTRSFFLKRAQEYGYIWLKGEVQLGNEIRKIATRIGKRTDLEAANDNEKKQRNTADLDNVLAELRTKKEILAEDYGIGYTQARQLTRLTDELVEKELKYAIANNDVPSRNHALSFLNQPADFTDEEKDEADTEKAQKIVKDKFQFETVFSDVPADKRMNHKLKKPIAYTSIAACIGSDEYYLEKHGFICKVALECDPDRAKYFEAMHKMRSEEQLQMIVGKLEAKFDELVEAFKSSESELLKCTIPCQCFCPMRGKNWRDDERLLLILYCIKFIKEVKPKYILFENAKEFFGFSLPLAENLANHPVAEELQKELNGRTIGAYNLLYDIIFQFFRRNQQKLIQNIYCPRANF